MFILTSLSSLPKVAIANTVMALTLLRALTTFFSLQTPPTVKTNALLRMAQLLVAHTPLLLCTWLLFCCTKKGIMSSFLRAC